jgi:hypothetical protein
MPTIKLGTQRELISLELHYGSYEPPEYHFHEYPDSTCWGETHCLVFSVSSRAPIVTQIAEVRSSFITIDQLQQVRFQHKKASTLIPQNHVASYFALSPARSAVPNPVIQLLYAPQPQSAHFWFRHLCPLVPPSPLPCPGCLLGQGCLQSHAYDARSRPSLRPPPLQWWPFSFISCSALAPTHDLCVACSCEAARGLGCAIRALL